MPVMATRRRDAEMMYTRTVCGVQKIVYKYQVVLRGWPPEIPFRSPGNLHKPDQVYALIHRLNRGTMWFQRLTDAQVARVAARDALAENPLARDSREDRGEKRNVRPDETRSQRLRPRPLKTTKWVPEGYD